MGIVIFIAGLGLAIVSPVLALQLLVVLAPFETISTFLGVDPRTYLAASLALRAAYDQFVHGARIPVRVQVVWSFFIAISAGVFLSQPAGLDAGELEKARYIFQYVMAASFAAFATMQLCRGARERHRLVIAFRLRKLRCLFVLRIMLKQQLKADLRKGCSQQQQHSRHRKAAHNQTSEAVRGGTCAKAMKQVSGDPRNN